MENLYIARTSSSPEISLDSTTARLYIKGESFMESPSKFYAQVVDWMVEFFKTYCGKIVLDFEFIYYNSSTFKEILNIFDEITVLKPDIEINWRYCADNYMILEYGQELCDEISVPVNLVRID